MNATQLKHGPFAQASPGWIVPFVVVGDAVDRIRLVKQSTDADWLKAVIRDRDCQATVRLAAERRLRWVTKAVKTLAEAARA